LVWRVTEEHNLWSEFFFFFTLMVYNINLRNMGFNIRSPWVNFGDYKWSRDSRRHKKRLLKYL